MARVTKVFVDAEFRLGLFHNIQLVDQTRMMTVEDVQRIEKGYRLALEVHPRVLGLVCVKVPKDAQTDNAVTKASEDLTRALGNKVMAVALVFPGDDMRATMFRTVVRGINVSTRGTSLRPCRTELEAATILAPLASEQLGKALSAQDLLDALADLRSLR